jgi:hypothetical protein
VIITAMKWGDRYLYPEGHPRLVLHKECGGEIDDRRRCTRCGADLEAWEVEPKLGPGAHASQREPGAPVAA